MANPATLDADGWQLESAVERNGASPGFEIPDEEERRSLRPGQRAKLLFLFVVEDEPNAVQCERIWVTLTAVDAEGRYVGQLESSPVTSRVLRAGDSVSFAAEHVSTVMIPVTDPRHPRYRPKG
jgi:hypothetical protein